MEQFKIRQDEFKEIRKAILIKAIPSLLLAVLGGGAIAYFNTNRQQSNETVLLFIIPLVLLILGFGIYRGINRQKEIFASYVLTLDENGITRKQHDTPTINISKAELSDIIKNPNRSFIIKGNSLKNAIFVPSQIEDYERLEKLLNEIKQISIKNSEPFFQKYNTLFSIIIIGLMVALYVSKDKIIVGISGVILLITLGYSFFEIQRNKNIDNKTKKRTRWIILGILSITGIMYFKLTGP